MSDKPWSEPTLQARAVLLPTSRCEDCGDQVVAAFGRAAVCGPCVRLATLRQRLARQPGAKAIRRATDR